MFQYSKVISLIEKGCEASTCINQTSIATEPAPKFLDHDSTFQSQLPRLPDIASAGHTNESGTYLCIQVLYGLERSQSAVRLLPTPPPGAQPSNRIFSGWSLFAQLSMDQFIYLFGLSTAVYKRGTYQRYFRTVRLRGATCFELGQHTDAQMVLTFALTRASILQQPTRTSWQSF